jgi:hypothetical protein
MTIYQYKRGKQGRLKNYLPPAKRLAFILYLTLFTILQIANIPKIFDFNFHLFIFEASLFYLLIVKKYPFLYFTILFFYTILDLVGGGIVGVFFISFLISFFIIKILIARYKNHYFVINHFSFSVLFLAFITIYTITQFLALNFLTELVFTKEIIIYVVKSIISNFLICLNFGIIFKNLLFNNTNF